MNEVVEEVAEQVNEPEPAKSDGGLKIQDVEGDWLQKRGQAENEDKILDILGNASLTARDCEKKLLMLLKAKNIELIKILVKQRNTIFFGILLKQAESQEEKTLIEEQMQSTAEGRQLLMEMRLDPVLERADEEIARAVKAGRELSGREA